MYGLCGTVNAARFLVHSSDQCQVCLLADVITCDAISQAFLAILELQAIEI